MQRYVGIGEAAALDVSVDTLRRWERAGKLVGERTPGGHWRYDLAKLRPELFRAVDDAERRTIGYARVSSHDQKEDLERQKQVLELYCARQGWIYEVVSDLGSGMNDRKKGLKKLLDAIVEGSVGRLVVTHKDRLLRFGAELVFAICEAKGVEVVILNRGEDTSFEEDLAQDVIEIVTVFSARLYGSRAHRNCTLFDGVARAAQETGSPDRESLSRPPSREASCADCAPHCARPDEPAAQPFRPDVGRGAFFLELGAGGVAPAIRGPQGGPGPAAADRSVAAAGAQPAQAGRVPVDVRCHQTSMRLVCAIVDTTARYAHLANDPVKSAANRIAQPHC